MISVVASAADSCVGLLLEPAAFAVLNGGVVGTVSVSESVLVVIGGVELNEVEISVEVVSGVGDTVTLESVGLPNVKSAGFAVTNGAELGVESVFPLLPPETVNGRADGEDKPGCPMLLPDPVTGPIELTGEPVFSMIPAGFAPFPELVVCPRLWVNVMFSETAVAAPFLVSAVETRLFFTATLVLLAIHFHLHGQSGCWL